VHVLTQPAGRDPVACTQRKKAKGVDRSGRHQLLQRTTPACRYLAVLHISSFFWTRRACSCACQLPARSNPPVQCCCGRCAPARLVASDPAASKQKAKRLRCPEERAVDENGKQAMELQLRRRSGEASNNAAASIIAGKSTSDCLWTRSGGATRLHRPAFLSFV
jgi:hypothetical protein